MLATLRQFIGADDGATAIEYALIAGMIALVIVAAVTAVGGQLIVIFTNVAGGFN